MNAFINPRFASGARIAREVAKYVINKGIKGKMLLNLNVPNLPLDEIAGVDVTKLGEKIYSAGIETGNDGRKDYYWILHRGIDMADVSGTDLWALKRKRVSITPLRFNRREYSTEFVHELAAAVAGRLVSKK
jgi:5'-nucleotidase